MLVKLLDEIMGVDTALELNRSSSVSVDSRDNSSSSHYFPLLSLSLSLCLSTPPLSRLASLPLFLTPLLSSSLSQDIPKIVVCLPSFRGSCIYNIQQGGIPEMRDKTTYHLPDRALKNVHLGKGLVNPSKVRQIGSCMQLECNLSAQQGYIG